MSPGPLAAGLCCPREHPEEVLAPELRAGLECGGPTSEPLGSCAHTCPAPGVGSESAFYWDTDAGASVLRGSRSRTRGSHSRRRARPGAPEKGLQESAWSRAEGSPVVNQEEQQRPPHPRPPRAAMAAAVPPCRGVSCALFFRVSPVSICC